MDSHSVQEVTLRKKGNRGQSNLRQGQAGNWPGAPLATNDLGEKQKSWRLILDKKKMISRNKICMDIMSLYRPKF